MSMPIQPLSPAVPAPQPERPQGPTAQEAADSLAAVQSQARDAEHSHTLDADRVRRLLADPL